MAGRTILRALILACSVAFLSAVPAGANLLTNGSFETGPAPGAYILLSPPSAVISGWVVTRSNIHYCSSSLWQISDGVRNLDLDGAVGSAGGIKQTFPTNPAQTYRVTWDLAGNPGSGPTIKTLRVEAAGQQATFTFSIAGKTFANMGYLPQTWFFTANDFTSTLEFYSITSPAGWGPVIDNVVVDVALPVRSGSWGRLKTLYR
jgi:choice-of-anchor C domain-containing protein